MSCEISPRHKAAQKAQAQAMSRLVGRVLKGLAALRRPRSEKQPADAPAD